MRRVISILSLFIFCVFVLSLVGCGDSSSSGALTGRVAYTVIPNPATVAPLSARHSRGNDLHSSSVERSVMYASNQTLKSIKLDGSDEKTVSTLTGFFDSTSMTPDFSKIVTFHGDPATGVGRIVSVAIDGSGVNYLTDGSFDAEIPNVTSKGDKIFYTNTGVFPWQMYSMNLDGSNKQLLMNHPELCQHEAAVSPDGTKIVMNMHDNSDGTINGTYVMNADGTSAVMISTPGEYWLEDLTFSSDGSKILYTLYTDSNGAQIYSMNSNGSIETALTSGPSDNVHPVVVGSRIVFMSDRNGGVELFSMKPDGSDVKQITGGPGLKSFHGFYD